MDERRIAVVSTYDELIAAFRARADELKVTRETLDSVSGLQAGYSGKLLAPVPMKSLGRVSLGPMLQAMGLAIVLVEDPEAMRRFAGQHSERRAAMRSGGEHEVVEIQISRRRLRRLSRIGAKKRNETMTPYQRSKAAKKAALARWRKHRARRIKRVPTAATPSPEQQPAPRAS